MTNTPLRRPLVLLIAFVLMVMAAPWFAPYNPDGGTTVSPTRYQPPSRTHLMGTDGIDRDLLSRVLRGSRLSIAVGVGAMIIIISTGAFFGIVSAMKGGSVDAIMMRFVDICLSIPRFLILLAVTSITDTSFTEWQMILLIGFTGWFDVARLMRGEVAKLLTSDWALASRAGGTGMARLVWHHIFPHLAPMLIVVATLGIGRTIVLEAGLSFLGAQTSDGSLGRLVHDGMTDFGSRWWLAFFPGLAIVLIVLACNALGDALRDVFAPEQVHAWPTT